MRIFPSDANGSVTTATVSAPAFFAASAMMGAEPVPVPPPMPQVMNTRDASPMAAFMSSMDSWAAFSPTAGFEPAPLPLLTCLPSIIFLLARTLSRCLASVFMAMRLTPEVPRSKSLSKVLLPLPPAPTMYILCLVSSMNLRISSSSLSAFAS